MRVCNAAHSLCCLLDDQLHRWRLNLFLVFFQWTSHHWKINYSPGLLKFVTLEITFIYCLVYSSNHHWSPFPVCIQRVFQTLISLHTVSVEDIIIIINPDFNPALAQSLMVGETEAGEVAWKNRAYTSITSAPESFLLTHWSAKQVWAKEAVVLFVHIGSFWLSGIIWMNVQI